MEFEKSRIERLKRSLYSRDPKQVPQEKRSHVNIEENPTPRDWGEKPSLDMSYEVVNTPRKNSFFNHFLGISLVFFCISLGAALFIFFGGLNMISSNNVDIKITGPSSIASGEELDADLLIINSNRTDLQNVILYIDYPDGTRSVGILGGPLTHDKIDIGTINQGKNGSYSLRTVFFGQAGILETIRMKLQYSVKGSAATFSKDKTYDVSIGSAPLILNVSAPKQVDSGQPLTLNIDLTSNSSTIVPDALVKLEYPYGFTYSSASLKPVIGNSIWEIGDLKNGDKKTLSVTGTLVGQNSEERSFRVSVGTKKTSTINDFDTVLAQSDTTVAINKSLFNLSVDSSGSFTPVAEGGQHESVTISWQNTLPDKILNGVIVATLSGNVFDQTSVSSSGGFYRSLDNTVTWDKNTINSLAEIAPGDKGQVSLSVGSFTDTNVIRDIKNPHIDIAVLVKGQKVFDSSSVSSFGTLTIKLSSIFTLLSETNRTTGPFTNTGPLPPRADQQSTYTVTWSLTNTTNDLSGAIVSASLPPGVIWLGNTSPGTESIVYNADTRMIVWNVGNIVNSTGYVLPSKQVSFQVGITPSITSIGQSGVLTSGVTASAHDTYTGATLSDSQKGATTRYQDPSYKQGDDVIIK